MYEKILKDIGLNINEAKAYLYLSKKGESTAYKLAKECNIHRPNAYDSLNSLVKKGLATSIIKEKATHYSMTEPECLKTMLKEKEDKIDSLIPILKLNSSISSNQSDVEIAEGITHLIRNLETFLNKNDDILCIGMNQLAIEMCGFRLDHFHKIRIDNSKHMKILYNNSCMKKASQLNNLPLTETKYLPEEYNSKTTTFICNNKTIIVTWSDPLKIIKITSKEIAESYKNQFKCIWNSALYDYLICQIPQNIKKQ